MKKRQQFAIFIAILILIVLAGFVLNRFVNTTSNSNNSSQNNNTTKSNDLSNQGQTKNTNEKIVYVKYTDNAKQIFTANADGQKEKLIYSDKDEEQKIKTFGGLAYIRGEILVLVASNETLGKLATINSETGEKQIIVDSFGNPESLAISPDGKAIAFVSFSNAEADYGYSLYTISRSGINRRRIFQSSKIIDNISFNEAANKIAFILTDNSGNSQINITNLSSSKTSSIYTASHHLLALGWQANNKITFSQNTEKFDNGELWQINPDGSTPQKVFESKERLPIFSQISQDSLSETYLLVKYGDTIDLNKSGELVLSSIKDNSLTAGQKITEANFVLGWLP